MSAAGPTTLATSTCATAYDHVEPIPDLFKLTDVNPLTGVTYAESRYVELPPYAAAVIGMTPEAWDSLALAGSVFAMFDPHQLYSLAPVLRTARSRPPGPPPSGVCPDCWGTLLAYDDDGSFTGLVDGVYLCGCAELAFGL